MRRRSAARKVNALTQQFLNLCYSLKRESKQHHAQKSKKRQAVHQNIIKYKLGKRYPGVYFTQREAECVTLLIEGYNDEQAGELLHISPRTVEYYLLKVKEKVHGETKSDIVDKVKSSDFMRKIREVKKIVLAT